MTRNMYDLVVLGGGTGGYVAAIRASQLGLKTAIIEKGKLGGTCLHAGCIPSKALLRSAEVYHTVQKADEFGISAHDVNFDFTKVMERKNKIVNQLHSGVQHLMKKGKIQVIEGSGTILPKENDVFPCRISVKLHDGAEEIVAAQKLIIATGSSPRSLPGLVIDGKQVITSDEALSLDKLPSSMIIVGGGVIGIEWASLLADFGVKVTVLEYAERIIPTEDVEISKEMLRLMKKRGVQVITGAKVLAETLEKTADTVTIQAEVKGGQVSYQAEQMLVSVGRLANTANFGLENTNVKLVNGVIETTPFFQTADPDIYAVGDVIGGLQLAHVAAHEGIIAVEHMKQNSFGATQADKLNPHPINYDQVPKCIYSRPECANVGLTEATAKEQGYQVKVGKFFFRAIGKALVYGESDGFVKFVSDGDSGKLLGVHMIGPHVTDMISEAGLAMLLEASTWQVTEMIHPHPSLSETIGETALAIEERALHS